MLNSRSIWLVVFGWWVVVAPMPALFAQQPQGAAQEGKKARAKNAKANSDPQWVWKNPQTPAGTQLNTFRSETLKGQEVSYLFWPPPAYDPQDKSKRYPIA